MAENFEMPDFMRRSYEKMAIGDVIDELWDHEDVTAKYRTLLDVFVSGVEDALKSNRIDTINKLCMEVRETLGED